MTITPELVRERLSLVQQDPRFKFYPGPHTYYLGEQKLMGATTFQKRFETPFDEEYWSAISAQNSLTKYGKEMTQQEVKELWRTINKRATTLGHAVHAWIESWLGGLMPEWPQDPEVACRVAKFLEFYQKYLAHLTPVAQEVMLFDEEWGLAGTFDFLAMHKDELYVLDWKTNAEFTSDDEGSSYGNLLDVFESEKSNKVNIYSIQTSVYRLMIERSTGFVPAGAAVIHIPPDLVGTWGTKPVPCKRYACKNYNTRLRRYFDNLLSEQSQ